MKGKKTKVRRESRKSIKSKSKQKSKILKIVKVGNLKVKINALGKLAKYAFPCPTTNHTYTDVICAGSPSQAERTANSIANGAYACQAGCVLSVNSRTTRTGARCWYQDSNGTPQVGNRYTVRTRIDCN
ncbi:Hypothetical protein Nlim_1290 [Candidatus Nitrosarchaeum limnium SFB1]|jgi:hypothetical protein|uniref:Uncharacterized protein n=1 Tax=Candidatus Nitrosarchaeum limnium SFB1 TaxID=886738 RepID=F3KLB0_9ARCH|nr:Hypothetical protein Nlim_1290 [Candidatus Nitrosarchaeum limnium SFB1]